jgi:hypothetical protein
MNPSKNPNAREGSLFAGNARTGELASQPAKIKSHKP